MNHFALLWLFSGLLYLSACSINTKFDDADYRPVGASKPLNPEIHTLNNIQSISSEKEQEPGLTRYVRPGEEASISNSKMHPDTRNNNAVTAITSSRQLSQTGQSQEKNSDMMTSSAARFKTRYGYADQVLKIYKTVKIHCQNKNLASGRSSVVRICQYQFPKFCGAHQFSIISNQNKRLLMFNDKIHHRSIIDTLQGDKDSAPGLWDKDDYVSTELLTISQLLNENSLKDDNITWIIDADRQLKIQLGQSYYTAINETGNCF